MEPSVVKPVVSINCSLSQGNHRQGHCTLCAGMPFNPKGQKWKKNKGIKAGYTVGLLESGRLDFLSSASGLVW